MYERYKTSRLVNKFSNLMTSLWEIISQDKKIVLVYTLSTRLVSRTGFMIARRKLNRSPLMKV